MCSIAGDGCIGNEQGGQRRRQGPYHLSKRDPSATNSGIAGPKTPLR
jgi:hypothetical protein